MGSFIKDYQFEQIDEMNQEDLQRRQAKHDGLPI